MNLQIVEINTAFVSFLRAGKSDRAIRRKLADRDNLLAGRSCCVLCCRGAARIDLFWATANICFAIALKVEIDQGVDLPPRTMSPVVARNGKIVATIDI